LSRIVLREKRAQTLWGALYETLIAGNLVFFVLLSGSKHIAPASAREGARDGPTSHGQGVLCAPDGLSEKKIEIGGRRLVNEAFEYLSRIVQREKRKKSSDRLGALYETLIAGNLVFCKYDVVSEPR